MLVGVLGFLQASGPIVTVFLAILCIVPLAIVVSVLLFIDRFEPEPLGMKLAALAWGGGVSIFFGIMGMNLFSIPSLNKRVTKSRE